MRESDRRAQERRHEAAEKTERWRICPSSFVSGVEPHAFQVLRSKRLHAFCTTCGDQHMYHGRGWRVGRGLPLALSFEEAEWWLARIRELKAEFRDWASA